MRSVSSFFICGLGFATAAFARDTATGAIRGTVGDSAGARIGASSIALVNSATNFRYSTTTDSFGRFAFELLPPGDYSAHAESPGMSPQTTPGLHVDVGALPNSYSNWPSREPRKGSRFQASRLWSKANPADSHP